MVVDEAQFVVKDVLNVLAALVGFQQPVHTADHGTVDFRRAVLVLTTNDGGGWIDQLVCLKQSSVCVY